MKYLYNFRHCRNKTTNRSINETICNDKIEPNEETELNEEIE